VVRIGHPPGGKLSRSDPNAEAEGVAL
jgi:hypothetical protein